MIRTILSAAILAVVATSANAGELQVNAGGAALPSQSGAPIQLGAVSISQQTDNTPGTSGVACGNNTAVPPSTTENSFYRRFYLNEHGAGPTASVSAVTIAIRDGNSGANAALPITVNLYTIPASTPVDTIPLASLTLIGSATANVSVPSGNAPTAFTIPVTGSIADTAASNLVVEWTNGVGSTTVPQFFPAANAAAETHPSFIRAPGCGLAAPATFASIGFTASLVMVVEGAGLPVSLQQFSVD